MNQLAPLAAVILLIISLILLVPTLVLFIECCSALLPNRRLGEDTLLPRPTVAVLVPAHNESLGIRATLQTILPQLTNQDLLLVIADNCDDDTAAIARETGAMVVERQDLQRRGKGYALDFGLKFLANAPPDVVIVIDADCIVGAGAVERIARLAISRGRPVQATYLLAQPVNPKG